MNKYQVMRDLTEAEYDELKQSIIENGLLTALDYDEHGNILDGHHRAKICQELGITPDKMVRVGLSEAEKINFAREVNTARRQLTPEEKRAMVERKLEEDPYKSDRLIAKQSGTSHQFVNNVRKDMESNGQLSTVDSSIGADGKERPRHTVRKDVESDGQVSTVDTSMAADGWEQPRHVERKPVSVFNPTAREEKAIQNPAVVEKLSDGAANVAAAIREVKREEIVETLENTAAKEAKAVQGVYDVIVIDPPWMMKKIERDVAPEQVEFDYPTMTESELEDLPIPSADACHMWLWTTHKHLPTALRLLEKWGFSYVCTFVWHKNGGFQPYGLPQYNCEFVLYARKGSPVFIDTKAFPVCFEAPRGGHSEKPETFYETVKRVTGGRRIDMFGRRTIDGFDSWGKEAPCSGEAG